MALRGNNIKALRYKQIGIFITNIRVQFFTFNNMYAYLHINIYTRPLNSTLAVSALQQIQSESFDKTKSVRANIYYEDKR